MKSSITLLTLSLLLSLVSCAHKGRKEVKLSYDAQLEGFEYPFQVERYKFKSQNQELEMAYMDIGAKDSKKVVILLHGKNFSGFYWEKVAKRLREMNYRVIIPDQIGFGKSTKPQYYQYSLEQLALNTKGLIDSLNIKKLSVVGHSMGGMVATKFNKLYPKSVTKLVLVNPIGLEKYLDYVAYIDPQQFFENELSKTPEKIRAYQKKNYYDGNWAPEYEELIQVHIGQLNHPDYPLVAWNNALTYGPIFTNPIVDDFSRITNPITLIVGTRDRTGPGRAFKREGVTYRLGQYHLLGKKLAKRFKKGKLVELSGLGHMPQFEDWNRFSKVFFREF